MIPCEALDNYVGFILRETGITPEDRWSQFSDIASELSIFDIFGGLCGGATLFPLPNHVRGQPVPAIKELGLTVWNASSRDIDCMLESGQLTKDNISSLRLMTVCDKTVRPEQLGAIFAAQPNITLLRTYGPIEATASCTLLRLYGDNYTIACQTSVALGDPIDNMQLHLVGGDTSEEGEIAITGPQLADGYWNDPETTQQSFRPLGDGGPLAFFTKEWAERRGGRLYIRPGRDGASVREPAQPAGST